MRWKSDQKEKDEKIKILTDSLEEVTIDLYQNTIYPNVLELFKFMIDFYPF